MEGESNRDRDRRASLARLAEAAEGLTPEQLERAVQVASKLMTIRARKRAAAASSADGGSAAINKPSPTP